MKCYAKIIRFPGLATEEYEYRYRCCDREFHVKFKRAFKGARGGEFAATSCGWIDLRYKEYAFQPADFCPECQEPIPRPWLNQNCDFFLGDVRHFFGTEA